MKNNAGNTVQTTACRTRNVRNACVGCWRMASVSLMIMAAGNQRPWPAKKDQKQATALYATARCRDVRQTFFLDPIFQAFLKEIPLSTAVRTSLKPMPNWNACYAR